MISGSVRTRITVIAMNFDWAIIMMAFSKPKKLINKKFNNRPSIDNSSSVIAAIK